MYELRALLSLGIVMNVDTNALYNKYDRHKNVRLVWSFVEY